MKDALLGLLVAGLTGVLLLGSCGLTGNGEEEKSNADSTYFRSTLNGKEAWGATDIRAVFSDNAGSRSLTLAGDTSHEEYAPYTEQLGFGVRFRGTDTYSLLRNGGEVAYFESDGDALIASYHPSESTDPSAHQLTITSYDSTTGVLEGTFRTTVVVDSAERVSEPGEPPRRRPDTLRFTDGEFRVKVRDLRDR